MSPELFTELRSLVGLDDADARQLAGVAGQMTPRLDAIIELFYDTLEMNPRARALLDAVPGRRGRLHISLLGWLRELFSGAYDNDYFRRRCEIGSVHVRAEVPQDLVFASMSHIRRALCSHILELNIRDPKRVIDALHKLLDLELTVMSETYRENFVFRVRRAEREEFRQKLSESEHLASFGQLAATMAHEIKNPLAGISGAIQVMRTTLAPDHPHRAVIAEILRQIDRLDATAKDLLVFARPKPPVIALHDLADVLERALILLRDEPAFSGILVTVERPDHNIEALIDPDQIFQVIENLMLNAAHACQRGGHVKCRLSMDEDRATIEVEDDGIGMAPETMARAFEPFYTTKAKGSGLGLSICQRIIAAHGGRVELFSEPGRGTRAVVELGR